MLHYCYIYYTIDHYHYENFVVDIGVYIIFILTVQYALILTTIYEVQDPEGGSPSFFMQKSIVDYEQVLKSKYFGDLLKNSIFYGELVQGCVRKARTYKFSIMWKNFSWPNKGGKGIFTIFPIRLIYFRYIKHNIQDSCS